MTASERRERLLSGINVKDSLGLEIGALCWPFILKNESEVIYVDYTDADTLRKKYQGDPGVDLAKIVEPDAIWGANSLQQAIGEDRKVDYIVASHVIEHVPDLITWLQELKSVLKEAGQVRLIVPDRRFTFDFLRTETRLSDVLHCYLLRARVPQPFLLFDFYLNFAEINCFEAWDGQVKSENIRRHNTFERCLAAVKDAVEHGTYQDVHCWVFTPHSFALLLQQLAEVGLVDFACERFFDTERNQLEFFVWLQASSDRAYVIESWRRMAETVQVEAVNC